MCGEERYIGKRKKKETVSGGCEHVARYPPCDIHSVNWVCYETGAVIHKFDYLYFNFEHFQIYIPSY